jgi:hypothetical protein
MTIQELAYRAQQNLESITSDSFKRSHVHEMLSASFGFNSYAAFSATAVFTLRRSNAELVPFCASVARRRCIELGYSTRTANLVSSALPAFLIEQRIAAMKLPDFVEALRERDEDYWGNFQNEDEEDGSNVDEDQDGYDDEDEEQEQADIALPAWDHSYAHFDENLILPITVEGLKKAASKEIALAHYALALVYHPDPDGQGPQTGISYWYEQEKQGQILTGVKKDWANAYAAHLVRVEDHLWHLREAARLGQQDARLDLAARFDDQSFFEQTDANVSTHPRRVAEIAQRLGRREDERKWLARSAEGGDTYAMRLLIEGHDRDDLPQCWTWIYLAELFGTDLTKDNYEAIHENGAPYDDDVGGPLEVIGEEGIQLLPLNIELEASARRSAQAIFERS